MSRARVIIYYQAPEGAAEIVEQAYHEASSALRGTPGLISNELLHDVGREDRFAVLSEWDSLDAFRAWEHGRDHRMRTSPLRSFQDRSGDRRHYAVYEVAARY
jgi:heme-degrading monooxygenase HmoA